MASAAQPQSLEDEVTCSICLDYFKNPVIIGCGHIFCQSCISRCWQGSDADFACPQCREMSQERKFQSIRQLGNLAEMLKHHLPSLKPQENVCVKHQQRLQLFCEDDQEPICVVCDRSRDHRSHTVVPVEEAAQEYKKMMQGRLIDLRSNLEDVKRFATDEETKRAELNGEFESQAEKVTRTFEDLQQFVEQEKKNILGKLEKEQAWHLQNMSLKITCLEKQKASFQDLIEEIEGKCHQDDVELLKDVRNILNRSHAVKALLPKNESVETVQSLQSFTSQHAYIQEKIREFKEALTLDPGTVLPKTGSLTPATSTETVQWLEPEKCIIEEADAVQWLEPEKYIIVNNEDVFKPLTVATEQESIYKEIKYSPETRFSIAQQPINRTKLASKGVLNYGYPITSPGKKRVNPKKPVERTDAVQPLPYMSPLQYVFQNQYPRN